MGNSECKHKRIVCDTCGAEHICHHAERIQLLPLDKDKLREFMKARGYDSETMTDSICQTFGTPKDAVSVEEFKIIARETAQKVYSYLNIDGIADSIAQAIHDLITRKLKGLDNEDFNE